MYRGVFAAPRPHGSGTSGRGRSLRTAAPGADCALLGPEDAATVVAWVVPMNPERVLAGARGQRRKVRSLVNGLKADQLITMRLHAGQRNFRRPAATESW